MTHAPADRLLTPLVEVPAGTLTMGSADHYPEEAPVVGVEVAAFRIEQHPVTNAQFAAFVEATGHVTVAEQALEGPVYAHLDAAERQPGSLVFTGTSGPVDLTEWRQWWSWVPGATWRMPQGPHSRARARADHPVVHVARADARAYARWAGRRLPTEAEHEWAAWGGAGGTEFVWGTELRPASGLMANTFQGDFPYRNRGAHGFKGTSPVGKFPANGYGLLDMIGNVWEWTDTPWTADHTDLLPSAPGGRGLLSMADGAHQHGSAPAAPCCGGAPAQPGQEQFVVKGGSHLCAPEYCQRYRPAARTPQTEESSTTHLGFRLVAD